MKAALQLHHVEVVVWILTLVRLDRRAFPFPNLGDIDQTIRRERAMRPQAAVRIRPEDGGTADFGGSQGDRGSSNLPDGHMIWVEILGPVSQDDSGTGGTQHGKHRLDGLWAETQSPVRKGEMMQGRSQRLGPVPRLLRPWTVAVREDADGNLIAGRSVGQQGTAGPDLGVVWVGVDGQDSSLGGRVGIHEGMMREREAHVQGSRGDPPTVVGW